MSEEKPDPSIAVNADEVLADPDDQTDTCITLCCFVCCFPIALIFWIFGGSTVAIAPAVAGAAIAVDKAKKDEVGKETGKDKAVEGPVELSRQFSRRISKSNISSTTIDRAKPKPLDEQ